MGGGRGQGQEGLLPVQYAVAGAEYAKRCVFQGGVNTDFTWPGNTFSNLAVFRETGPTPSPHPHPTQVSVFREAQSAKAFTEASLPQPARRTMANMVNKGCRLFEGTRGQGNIQ